VINSDHIIRNYPPQFKRRCGFGTCLGHLQSFKGLITCSTQESGRSVCNIDSLAPHAFPRALSINHPTRCSTLAVKTLLEISTSQNRTFELTRGKETS